MSVDPWPSELTALFSSANACEYASLTRSGRPVTVAVTPYVGTRTIDISTGLAYPQKAERARRNPHVALLFSDSTGWSGPAPAPIVLVEGLASVRDADLQANADRYARESLQKATVMRRMPKAYLRTMAWYLARIYVEVTPTRVTWWSEGDLTGRPVVWTPPTPPVAAPSDPPPTGKALAPREEPPSDWGPVAARAQRLGAPVVTMVVGDRPQPVRTVGATRTSTGFDVTLPAGIQGVDGPVCLTFHRVGEGLSWQENVALLGRATVEGARLEVVVERALPDWSLRGNFLQRTLAFNRPSKELRRRLVVEAERRGQPPPTISLTRR